jgi:cytochrome b
VAGPQDRLAVWDAPTRLFHWSLVILIGLMWWSGEQRLLDWHRLAGYALLTLLLFRLAWGVAGSTTARFASFMRSPGAVARYIRRDMFTRGSKSEVGHNALGGWSVIVMLLLLLLQVLLGFVSVDVDGLESGPFAHLVDFDTGRRAAGLHELLFNVLLGVMALHVAAVIFYLAWRRDDLITPMLSGRRSWNKAAPVLTQAPAARALLLLGASALLVWGLIAGLGQA